MKTIELKINKPVGGKNAGDVVRVEVDRHGTPLDQFWRRRLYDAETDRCVEIVKATKGAKE